MGQIWDTLQSLGQLDNTYFIVTSDHGFCLGQHRVIGKDVAYDESTRVPLFVCGPGVSPAQEANHLLAHFDVTATVLELAGAERPDNLDAKSFVPLLTSAASIPAETWRTGILIEHWESVSLGGTPADTTYTALRLYDQMYVQWADGENEYYDLRVDPSELQNEIESLPSTAEELFDGLMRIMKQDHTPPLATVVRSNSPGNSLLGLNSKIFGYGADDTGLKRIALIVRDPLTNRYWDGASWQSTYVRARAANLTARRRHHRMALRFQLEPKSSRRCA